MGTSFSKLHPKSQQKMRLVIKTLPPEIQQNILTHKAITSSYDRWMYLFKVLVSTTFIRTEDKKDDIWLSHKATWYEIFGEAKKVYEGIGDRYNPYPKTEDPVIRGTLWLSEMLKAGFISKVHKLGELEYCRNKTNSILFIKGTQAWYTRVLCCMVLEFTKLEYCIIFLIAQFPA